MRLRKKPPRVTRRAARASSDRALVRVCKTRVGLRATDGHCKDAAFDGQRSEGQETGTSCIDALPHQIRPYSISREGE